MICKVILLLFRPARFARIAVEHDSQLPPTKNHSLEELTWERVKKIRHSLATGFSLVLLTSSVAGLSALILHSLFGPAPPLLATLFQISSAAIILGATLALLGWEIQSFKGQTLPEKVNRFLYRLSYVIGTYLFVLSLTWSR